MLLIYIRYPDDKITGYDLDPLGLVSDIYNIPEVKDHNYKIFLHGQNLSNKKILSLADSGISQETVLAASYPDRIKKTIMHNKTLYELHNNGDLINKQTGEIYKNGVAAVHVDAVDQLVITTIEQRDQEDIKEIINDDLYLNGANYLVSRSTGHIFSREPITTYRLPALYKYSIYYSIGDTIYYVNTKYPMVQVCACVPNTPIEDFAISTLYILIKTKNYLRLRSRRLSQPLIAVNISGMNVKNIYMSYVQSTKYIQIDDIHVIKNANDIDLVRAEVVHNSDVIFTHSGRAHFLKR